MHKKNNFKNIKASYLFGLLIFSIYNTAAQTVSINEVVSSNSVHLDEDGDAPDWLEVHNFGTEDVSINGWSLSDDVDGNSKWILPNITLTPDQYMVLIIQERLSTKEMYSNT